ncbi:hypothetical protein EGH21_10325 [Halomicroarcula sp. F13]|uniref:Uncharacterized protein n=1 Tax=Haloarcula rubra TaxID=2487747 RepID=A0AAW4PP72_9EURY|nr:hypothetical protein [Halomicroarcula rubra]MBX0323423.1 hypothetical protein [Halomicroarcula rubra]
MVGRTERTCTTAQTRRGRSVSSEVDAVDDQTWDLLRRLFDTDADRR